MFVQKIMSDNIEEALQGLKLLVLEGDTYKNYTFEGVGIKEWYGPSC